MTLTVRHQPWSEPLTRPRMSNAEDARPGLSLTSRYVSRGGVPVIPVTGEMTMSPNDGRLTRPSSLFLLLFQNGLTCVRGSTIRLLPSAAQD